MNVPISTLISDLFPGFSCIRLNLDTFVTECNSYQCYLNRRDSEKLNSVSGDNIFCWFILSKYLLSVIHPWAFQWTSSFLFLFLFTFFENKASGSLMMLINFKSIIFFELIHSSRSNQINFLPNFIFLSANWKHGAWKLSF